MVTQCIYGVTCPLPPSAVDKPLLLVIVLAVIPKLLVHMIQKGQSPLWFASSGGRNDIASLLLELDLPNDVRHSNTMYTVHIDSHWL